MSGVLAQPRIRVPRAISAGETFEVRTLIEHPMETGLGQDGAGAARNMLTRLAVRVNGEVAMQAELRNGTAANPYHVFFLKLDRESELEFSWTDERGRVARATARVMVT